MERSFREHLPLALLHLLVAAALPVGSTAAARQLRRAADAMNAEDGSWESTAPDILQSDSHGLVFPFIHIQKTAGSAFHACLRTALVQRGAAGTWQRFFPHDGDSWSSPGCARPRGVGGSHCSVAEIEDCVSEGYASLDWARGFSTKPSAHKFVTVIRNPVARVIAEYQYWEEAGAEALGPPPEMNLFNHSSRGLAFWVTHPFNVGHNRMVKHLTAPGSTAPIRRDEQDCVSYNTVAYQKLWSQRYGLEPWDQSLEALINSDTRLVDAALQNTFFIGIQEDLSGSVAALVGVLLGGVDGAVDCSTERVRLSQAPNMSGVSETVLQEIRQRNQLDLVLYRYALYQHTSPLAPKTGGLDISLDDLLDRRPL